VDADGAAATARRGVLLDARAAERYRGEREPVDPVAGHIPGAVSVPIDAWTRPDGRALPIAEMGPRLTAAGVRPGVDVAAYCGSGVTAAQTVLLLRAAGVEAALYPGSWSDWVSDPARPVATGADA
jgi:thiosulfate/3-mercaptopyruvate sulfurtransferase